MAQRLVGPASVGSITGLVQTFGMTGGFLGPLLTGGLVSYFGLGPVLFGSAAVTLWLYSLFVIPFKEASWR